MTDKKRTRTRTLELTDNEVKVKIKDEIISLKPEIIEKLTMNEQSFFRGAVDFYNNKSNTEKQPIDLSSAPHIDRFHVLLDFLKIGFTADHSLCVYDQPEELFELAEYL